MNYIFQTKGRLSRKHYLIGLLIILLATFLSAVIVGFINYATEYEYKSNALPIIIIISVAATLLQFKLAARRFNDLGWSSWSILLLLIPLVNVILILMLFFMKGSSGPNKYGEDPTVRMMIDDMSYIDQDDATYWQELRHESDQVVTHTQEKLQSVTVSQPPHSKSDYSVAWILAGAMILIIIIASIASTNEIASTASVVEGANDTRNISVESVEASRQNTVITFKYTNYNEPGDFTWINIDPNTIIKSKDDSGLTYKLLSSENIPMSPDKHYFSSVGEVVHFKLIFPPLNKSTSSIDIIECESESCFNFYNQRVNFTLSSQLSEELYRQGVEYYEKGNYKEAETYFSKAIMENQQDPHYYDWRGWTKYEMKNYKGAVSDYLIAIELDPNNASYYHAIGIIKSWQDQFKSSIHYYSKAIEKDNANYVFYFNRAKAYESVGKYGAALDDINTSIRLKPDDGDLFHERGLIKLELKQIDSSCADFVRAIDLGNDDAKQALQDNCK